MNIHIRIHHWVLWWLCIGIVVGVVALVNILFRNLTRTQDHVILIVGMIHWILGGFVCWAFDGAHIQNSPPPKSDSELTRPSDQKEWHPASDFLFPGGRKRMLPPKF
jgi:amino acid transporter